MGRMTAPPRFGTRTLNLALQGGGSHGAFTWGVLDAVLADERIALEGLSGTSAGAVNAVALASGYATALAAGRDPRQGARDCLTRIWDEVASWGALGNFQRQLAAMMWGGLPADAAGNFFGNAFKGMLSPYQANPLDINPLRSLLERELDFGAMARHAALKVFVSATHVRTGKAVIFTGKDLNVDAVMASACLPTLFKAVEIEGEHYWDGGYAANPPLTPLIEACASGDLMLVQINPLRREAIPQTPGDIFDRVNELTFNASLLTQMRSIDLINQLIARGALKGQCKTVRLHRIDGGETMMAWPASSRASTDPAMIRKMFEAGQAAARHWVASHLEAIGHRTTIDIRRDYLDDTRDIVLAPMQHRPRGFRPWLEQLFRRSKYA